MVRAATASASTGASAPETSLSSTLRSAGLRCTASRLAVLDLLVRTAQPQSHAQVFGQLEARGFDRATVYRNLLDLVEVRIARRTDLGDHVWRFTVADRERATLHFLCTDCGEIQELPESSVRLAGSRRTPRAFRRRDVAVQVKGRCDGCS
jgi:Fur family ferric uptake transcriptional regulator